MRQRVSAERRLLRGKASKYIRTIKHIHSGDRVVLCLRVSRSQQHRRGNLSDQEANLRRIAEHLGAIIVGVVAYVGSGCDPFWLARAVVIAKRHGAKLLAETTDRFIRHPGYHSDLYPGAQARELDLRDLQKWTEGLPLVTDMHPDAPPAEVRRYHVHRGQREKGSRGGRLARTKRERWNHQKDRAIQLHQAGLSEREIANRLGKARTQINRSLSKQENVAAPMA